MTPEQDRRDPRRNCWPFVRTNSIGEWIEAGQRFFESAYEVLVRQKELTPETLRGISDYVNFEKRPDIHSLVYVKSDVFEQVHGARIVLIAFMAPSAGGKDTILKRAWPAISGLATKIITHTTRKPREDESDGGNYHFVAASDFERQVSAEAFAEHLPPGEQGEHWYGTAKHDIEQALQTGKRIVIWRGEFIGWKELKYWMNRNHPDVPCVSIFTIPKTSLDILMQWIRGKRGDDPKEHWRQRKAQLEIIAGGSADVFIVNPLEEGGQPTQATGAFVALLQFIHDRLAAQGNETD